jgi:hypothetical protein
VYAETTHDKTYGAVYIVDVEGVDPNTQGIWAGHRVVVVDLATGEVHQRPLAGGGIPFFWTSHTLVLTGPAPTPPSASRTVAATPTSTTDPDPSAFEERERTLLWSFPEGAVREGPIGRPLAAAATGDRFIVRNFDDGPGKAESDKSVVYRVHDLGTLQVVAWFWEPLSRATDFDPLLSDDGRTWIREDLPIPRAVQSQGPAPALPSWLRPKNVTQMAMASDGRYVFIVGTGRRGEPDVRAVGVLACDPAVPAGAEMPCARVALEGEWVGWLRSLNGEG